MVAGTRLIKSRYVSIIIPFCLVVLFFLLMNNIQTVRNARISGILLETSLKTPGAYLKFLEPNLTTGSYCKLNYGLPTQLVYTKNDLQDSPELEKNSPYHILYDVIEGKLGQDNPGVTYVTHLTKDFLLYISEVVRYWEGPISVAAYVPDGNPKIILESMLHFCYCIPEMSRVSLHLVIKKDMQMNFYLSRVMPPKTCDTQDLVKMNSGQILSNSDISNNVNKNKNLDNWYPINVCRNAARQAAYTEYVLVCDVELMPSQGLASRFIDMTESYKCVEPDCGKRVFVVPVFEVESTEDVPRTKNQLINLIKLNRAVYFHQISCSHCQKFPGLEQWKESDPGNVIKPLLETKREVPYHRWEPVYIGTKNEPMYYEKLSWEGFQDKMLQMLEMCLAGYKLVILDGAFLVHWPGMKTLKKKDEAWRLPYVKMNEENYNALLKNITNKYPANQQCRVKTIK